MITSSICTIDTHTEGEPTRIITSRVGRIPGRTVKEKNNFFRQNHDHIRKRLMSEPRGHRDMFGCILMDSISEENDYGVIFMDNHGYMNMCGHATIGLCTVLCELGMVRTSEPLTKIRLETAGGVIEVDVTFENGVAERVKLRNVPSFVHCLDVSLQVPDIGTIKVDVAYGGNFFVFFSSDDVGLEIKGANTDKLIDIGERIRNAANDQIKVVHPENADLNKIYVATIVGKPSNPKALYKNVHLFGRQFGRSPGGTGTSAMLAVLSERGRIKLNEEIFAESITGGLFAGRLIERVAVGNKTAYIPEITGSARITGFHNFVFSKNDHLANGFLV